MIARKRETVGLAVDEYLTFEFQTICVIKKANRHFEITVTVYATIMAVPQGGSTLGTVTAGRPSAGASACDVLYTRDKKPVLINGYSEQGATAPSLALLTVACTKVTDFFGSEMYRATKTLSMTFHSWIPPRLAWLICYAQRETITISLRRRNITN
jgi:hypothetical protein